MDKSLSLGMPMSSQEICKKYKRQSLGMPKASPLHQQNTRSSFTCYIFIASYVMCCSWSVLGFVFCFILLCFVLINKSLDHSILVWERDTLRCTASYLFWSETRS